MRRVIAIACLALGACTGRQQANNDVDLNAAAQAAQGDIDNYAATRHSRKHPAVRAHPAAVAPDTGHAAP